MNNNRSGKQAKSLAANINLFICLFVDAVRTHVVFACMHATPIAVKPNLCNGANSRGI